GLGRGDHGLAAAAGQVHVEQHHVRLQLGDHLDRGLDVVGLADHLDLVAELGPDAGPEQAVVIDDHDPGPATAAHPRVARRCCSWHVHVLLDSPLARFPAERGMVSDTSVPWPGALRTRADPPRRLILACTDSASPLRSPATASGSKPRPRSLTKTDTSSGST